MDYQDLCRAALDRFGARCFDNLAIDREGGIDREQARLIARTLRLRGGRDGFLLGREIEAMIRDGGEETVVQWMDDTVVRFFPVVEDPVFGFRLHDADLAINKVMAGASRSEARDAVDLARLHRDYLPLGHLVWAAAGKTVLSPDALAEHIVRNAVCQNAQAFAAVRTSHPFDPREVVETLLKARDEALALAGRLPTRTYGCLFLDRRGEPIAASAEMIEAGAVVPHAPRPYGAWPVFSISPD